MEPASNTKSIFIASCVPEFIVISGALLESVEIFALGISILEGVISDGAVFLLSMIVG
jgi:hypothetical protein